MTEPGQASSGRSKGYDVDGVPFEEAAVRAWLEHQITYWRGVRDEAEIDSRLYWVAVVTVINFQTVYGALFVRPYKD